MNAPTPRLLRDVRIDGTSKGMPPVSDPVPPASVSTLLRPPAAPLRMPVAARVIRLTLTAVLRNELGW